MRDNAKITIPNTKTTILYRLGKSRKQALGINTIAKIPRSIAEFWSYRHQKNTPNNTGHCFRRSLASLLADTGVDMSILKRHGGWKSSSLAKGYVENRLERKKIIAAMYWSTETLRATVNRLFENPVLPMINTSDDLLAASQPSSSTANTARSTPNHISYSTYGNKQIFLKYFPKECP